MTVVQEWIVLMTNLVEIEAAIQQLPEQEVRQLATWLQTYLDEKWERQLEPDLASGKLDRLIARAEADIAARQIRDEDARQRFRNHAGAVSLGYATGAENEAINADLARAYADEC